MRRASRCVSPDERLGVRLARSAAAVDVDVVALRVSLQPAALQHTLSRLPARGRCDDLAAEMLASRPVERILRARACPPQLRRTHPAEHTSWGVPGWRSRHALDAGVPAGLVRRCAGLRDAIVRAQIARNVACVPVLCDLFSVDHNPDIRNDVAAQRATPPWILDRLAQDAENSVAVLTAKNPSLGAATWEALAVDPEPSIRAAAARNPSAGGATLAVLASDPDPDVAANIAKNPVCPPEILDEIRRGRPELEEVTRLVQLNRDLAAGSASDTSSERLNDLASHDDRQVREAVAQNPRTASETLWRLCGISAQPSHRVNTTRAAVAANPACPAALLLRLREDPEPLVRAAVVGNPAGGHKLRDRVGNEMPAVRCSLICNPATGTETLRTMLAITAGVAERTAIRTATQLRFR